MELAKVAAEYYREKWKPTVYECRNKSDHSDWCII